MGEHPAHQLHETRTVTAIQIAGWSAFALLTFSTLLPTVPASVIPRLAATKLTRAALGLGTSQVLYRLYTRFGLRPWAAGAVIALGTAWYVLFVLVTGLWRPAGSPGIDWRSVPHNSIESIIVLGAWSAAYAAIISWRRADAALRYQLTPHFLFNALSSIRALILEDPHRARTMVTGFADLLRQSLEVPASGERSLKEETAVMAQYLAIEQERFGAALDVAFEVDAAAGDCRVPIFLLHPLVENAITHGRRTSPSPLRVRLRADATAARLRIEVANTGSIRGRSPHRSFGLTSVRDRLSLLYRSRQSFSLTEDNGWVRAVIEIRSLRS